MCLSLLDRLKGGRQRETAPRPGKRGSRDPYEVFRFLIKIVAPLPVVRPAAVTSAPGLLESDLTYKGGAVSDV